MAPHPSKPKKNALSIRLAESAVFLHTDGTQPRSRRAALSTSETHNAMLRGVLVLDIIKPMKISSIEVDLVALTSTAWPEGIGADRIKVTEEHRVFHASTTYFRASRSSPDSSTRRTASIGPGVSYTHTVQHHDSLLDTDGVYDYYDDLEDASWDGQRRREAQDNAHDSSNRHDSSENIQHQSPGRDAQPPPSHTRRPSSLFRHLHPHRHTSPSVLTTNATNSDVNTPPQARGRTSFVEPHTNRRVSVDGSHFSRLPFYESNPGELVPIPPYSPLPPTQNSPGSEGGIVAVSELPLPSPMSISSAYLDAGGSGLTPGNLPNPESPKVSVSRHTSFGHAIPEDAPMPDFLPMRDSSPVAGPRSPSAMGAERSTTFSHNHNRDSGSYSHLQTHEPTGSGETLASPSSTSHHHHGMFHRSNVSSSTERSEQSGTERGRKGSRFSLSAVSNMLMDAVRSSSPKTSQGHERDRSADVSPTSSGVGGHRRGRTMERGREVEVEPEAAAGVFGKLLKDKGKDREEKGDGWKEFKPGTYTYPISFNIPNNAPPSMQCSYGSVSWRLNANVHRPGTFKTKMTATRDVIIIASPTEDDTEDTENIIVERHWDQQLQYLISISGRSFYVGGTVPVTFTLMPLAKIKVFRISVFLEEKVDYYTHMRRIAWSDPPTRFPLLSIKHEGKHPDHILPLVSDDVEVLRNSPLYQVVNPEDDLDEVASTLMGPGPWTFHRDLKLPTSCDLLKFTNRNRRANIVVTHMLKLVMRVERGDDRHVDKAGKRKLFDIVVQTPVLILSCRCNPEWTSLPRYAEVFDESMTILTPSCPCQVARQRDPGLRGALDRMTTRHSSDSGASAAETSPVHPSGSLRYNMSYHEESSIMRSSTLFERLVSGMESETGEAPPAYGVASSSRPPAMPLSNGVALL